jgi:hypothetical protein
MVNQYQIATGQPQSLQFWKEVPVALGAFLSAGALLERFCLIRTQHVPARFIERGIVGRQFAKQNFSAPFQIRNQESCFVKTRVYGLRRIDFFSSLRTADSIPASVAESDCLVA